MTHYDGMAEAELRGEIMRLEVSLGAARKRVAELEAANERLRADSARLDWVLARCSIERPNKWHRDGQFIVSREEIDTAMAAEAAKEE